MANATDQGCPAHRLDVRIKRPVIYEMLKIPYCKASLSPTTTMVTHPLLNAESFCLLADSMKLVATVGLLSLEADVVGLMRHFPVGTHFTITK